MPVSDRAGNKKRSPGSAEKVIFKAHAGKVENHAAALDFASSSERAEQESSRWQRPD